MTALARVGEAPIGFPGSYDPADVTFLLTPIDLAPTPVEEKERLIQGGQRHYSEMLSAEPPPGPDFLAAYHAALAANGPRLARDIARLALALANRSAPVSPTLVSLARAGTPVGVLLRRALARLGHAAPHYSVSIIRDRGLDRAAMRHILARHAPESLVFVDGWTGKGAIAGELAGPRGAPACGITPFLAVVADPAGVADLAATGDDYVIPSGILNGVVSGLVSRSVLNDRVPPGTFHGCRILDDLAPHDRSRAFVDAIDAHAAALPPLAPATWPPATRAAHAADRLRTVAAIVADAGVDDINRIKPGIAEATRAVLRRVPARLYLANPADPELRHLADAARARGIEPRALPVTSGFRAVAVIRGMAAE